MNIPKLRRSTSLSINDARIAGLYDLEHTIGKGHFAIVKLARHVFTGEMVAVKVIDKTKLDSPSRANMMQEVLCMKLVQHPNIVRLYEIIDTQTKLFLILELGDYDMYEYIMRKGLDKSGCKESDAQVYFNQIVKAIDYCHKLHVVHRDLKPENVVFFERLGMVKLTDFGFSNLFTPGQQLNTSCGSLAYSAPEILLGDAYDAPAVDVWSLGVILYMLVCGRLPFQESNESETLIKILDCKFSLPENLSPECKRLISRMLVKNPRNRANLSEIIESSWVMAGDRGHAENLPLIFKEHLPECAHDTIVEQMIKGNVGTEEEIVGAVESNGYNYMSATYYLLAERVLSSYRQEQAKKLMSNKVSQEYQEEKEFTTIRSRSRSNSWRGPPPRRACSVLREESEEDLESETSYPSFRHYASSQRQSSRFFITRSRSSLLGSRAGSNDAYLPDRSADAIIEDEFEPDDHDTSSFSFNKSDCNLSIEKNSKADLFLNNSHSLVSNQKYLTPIKEMGAHMPPKNNEIDGNSPSPSYLANNQQQQKTRFFRTPLTSSKKLQLPPRSGTRNSFSSNGRPLRNASSLEIFPVSKQFSKENDPSLSFDTNSSVTLPPTPSSWTSPNNLERCQPFTNLAALRTSFSTLSIVSKRRNFQSLSRRNSSPSDAATARLSSLHLSSDHINPQAIREMLEFSRLSSAMRRTASPDSRLPSRSPSPSCCSSGRTSPVILTLSSRFKSQGVYSGSCGMRKLSSSPHLLGICEETEEADLSVQPLVFESTPKDDKGSTHFTAQMLSSSRNKRSSSMGYSFSGSIGRTSGRKLISLTLNK